MPKAKAATASLAGMIESEDEQANVDILQTEDSNQENLEPATASNKNGKTRGGRKLKPASKRLSAGKAKTATRKNTRRAPLKTQVNEENVAELDQADDLNASERGKAAEEPAIVPKVSEKAPPKRKGRPPKKAIEPAKEEEPTPAVPSSLRKDGEFEYTPTTARQAAKGRSRAKKVDSEPKEPSVEPTAPSLQIEHMDLDESIEHNADDPLASDLNLSPEYPEDTIVEPRHRASSRARSTSHQPSSMPNPRKRQLSVSSADDPASAPALRRKLGDLTNRYTSLESRYKNLVQVGIKEAETNFKNLQKASEEREGAAQSLIAGLKKEIAAQRAIADEAKEDLEDLDTAKEEIAALQTRLEETAGELGDVQAENRALQARLVASRNAAASLEAISAAAKTPGSAVKGKVGGQQGNALNGTGTRTIMVGSAEAAAAAQVAMLKEELYGDLTGLLIRGVERGEDSEVYDCIQTGRNGSKHLPFSSSTLHHVFLSLSVLWGSPIESRMLNLANVCAKSFAAALHFKLALSTDPSLSFDETEFTYLPQLDAGRDRDLIAIMPEYLAEDITFSRPQAAKFYSRVADTLTRKVEE